MPSELANIEARGQVYCITRRGHVAWSFYGFPHDCPRLARPDQTKSTLPSLRRGRFHSSKNVSATAICRRLYAECSSGYILTAEKSRSEEHTSELQSRS